MIVFDDDSKVFFNSYRSVIKPKISESKTTKSNDKSKGLEEVNKINEKDPETFDELVKIYESLY